MKKLLYILTLLITVNSFGQNTVLDLGTGTTSTGGTSDYVPKTRTLTINGVAHNLSTDATWTISGSGDGVNYRYGLALISGNVDVDSLTLASWKRLYKAIDSLKGWNVTQLALKENSITAGTTSQYWRGDKTWQTLDKSAVGLSNVDNTSDANKPVSTATQTALNLKAPLASPTFTGTVTVPTPTTTTGAANKAYVDNAISGVTAGSGNLPTGGAVGQVLTKASSTNYDAAWITPTSGSGGIGPYDTTYYNILWFIPQAVKDAAKNDNHHPFGDGTGHPLSLYYTSLANARVDFPMAWNISDDVETLALQKAIDYALYNYNSKSQRVYCPKGDWTINRVQGGYGLPFVNRKGVIQDYTTLILIGDANSDPGQGTTFHSTDATYCLNVQGGAYFRMYNISFTGINGSITGGPFRWNYVSTYGLPANADSRYAAYTGLLVDYYSQFIPGGEAAHPMNRFNPEYASLMDTTWQWGRHVSTDFKIFDCQFAQFVDCIGKYSTANGDFFQVFNSTFSNCINGIADGYNQGRNSGTFNCKFSMMFNAFSMYDRGQGQGKWMSSDNDHFSVVNMFDIAYMVWSHPLTIIHPYIEQGVKFGRFGIIGNDPATSVYFINPDLDFTAQNGYSYTPINLAEGAAQLVVQGGVISGKNLDMDMGVPPILENVRLKWNPGYAYDNRYNVQTDLAGNQIYYRAYVNHPIGNYTSKRVIYKGRCTVDIGNYTYVLNDDLSKEFPSKRAGSNYYPYKFNFPGSVPGSNGINPGTTGLPEDYLWTNNNYISGVHGRFYDGWWKFKRKDLPTGDSTYDPVVRIGDIIQPGDIIEGPQNKQAFITMAVDYDSVLCLLKNNFLNAGGDNHVAAYVDTAKILTITDLTTNWYWYSGNHYTTAPTKGTATTTGVTGLAYILGALGHETNPGDQFRAKSIVYIYNYDIDYTRPTSKIQVNAIKSIDATAGTITFLYPNTIVTSGQVAVVVGSTE